MKKITAFFLVLCALLSLCVSAGAADDGIILAAGGEAKAVIIIPSGADESVTFAADILKERLGTLTGAQFRVADDSTAKAGTELVLGSTSRREVKPGSEKNGSFVIISDGGSVYINGTGSSGTLDGVYRFLRDYCGYTVYEAGITSAAHFDTLSVPDGISISYSPFFESRKLDTQSVYDPEYSRAHLLNGSEVRKSEQGVYVPYLGTFCHSLATLYCSRDTYFAEHPEYFALRDGKRVPDQLCLTNENVYNIVVAEVLDLLKKNHDPGADLQIVSLTQDDNPNYCTCDACAALDAANGSQAGTMLTFVNRVAAAVKAAGYDNVAIDTFAYQYTRGVPSQVKPADNVIVRLCSIECCFGHTLDDPACAENAAFLKDLKGWSEICDRLYIWDYVNNYSETFCPFANFQVLQRNMQIFYENGAKGIYEEGNYYMNICNGEFYELRSFLLAALMEDPYRTDIDSLTDDYLAAVYGPGGKYLKEYLNIITRRSVTNRKHLHIRQQPREALPGITRREINKIDELWKSAKAEAVTAQQLERIERSEISWQYWKCSNFKKEYSPLRGLYSYMLSHKELCEKIQAFGNTAVGEGAIKRLSVNPFRVMIMPCDFWESKHDGLFYDKLDNITEGLFELLTKLHS